MNALGSPTKVSVLMPCYNEGNRIDDSLAKVGLMLGGTGLDYEIAVVDDGSTDGTAEEASKILDGKCQLKRKP